MTVKELRALLALAPDDATIEVEVEDLPEDRFGVVSAFHEIITFEDREDELAARSTFSSDELAFGFFTIVVALPISQCRSHDRG